VAAYLIAFLGGFAGSFHCVGMCGGFPLALARAERQGNASRQVLYNLGRVNALGFIGALCGGVGAVLVASGPGAVLERALAVVAGVLMMAIGLESFGLLTAISARGAALARATIGRVLGGVMASRSLAAPLALGVFNAFLPCQLIYAFAARAAATASAASGALTMLAFGAGTVPAMLALGLGGGMLSPAVRSLVSRAGGVLVIAFGAWTALRGIVPADALPHALHHP
jgi:uncharacterized protein